MNRFEFRGFKSKIEEVYKVLKEQNHSTSLRYPKNRPKD